MKQAIRKGAGVLLALTLATATAPGAAAEATPDPARETIPDAAPSTIPDAAPSTIPDVAGRAELQRLLTQRIARAYCQAGLGVAPAESGQELLESVVLFDHHLSKLKQTRLPERERPLLAEVERSWKPFRAAAMRRFTREGCETVSRRSEEVLRVTTELAREAQGRTGAQNAGTLSAISVRQRVLAQKLARLYMARAWGLDSVTLREEIASTRNEFSGALAKLQEAPGNSAAVNERLKQVALQWVWLDTALEQGDYPSYGLVVADSTDAITRDMAAVTRLYQKLPDSGRQPVVVGLEWDPALPFGPAVMSQTGQEDAVAMLNREH